MFAARGMSSASDVDNTSEIRRQPGLCVMAISGFADSKEY
jgi:hypothetical protein